LNTASNITLQRHRTENWKKYSQKWNCAASFPIPTFIISERLYEYGTRKRGRAVWFLGIHRSDLLCSVVISWKWESIELQFSLLSKQSFSLLSELFFRLMVCSFWKHSEICVANFLFPVKPCCNQLSNKFKMSRKSENYFIYV
jgi:hypothetical protein